MKKSWKNHPYGWLILFAGLLPVIFVLSIYFGYTQYSISDILKILIGQGSDMDRMIIFEFRFPRSVLAVLVGACLAVSGSIIQSVTRNPLADPGLMGINAGAGFMVVVYVVALGTHSVTSIMVLPLLALVGGGTTGLVIYLLAFRKDQGIHPMRLVLNGVAVNAGISAAMTLIVATLNTQDIDFLAKWQAGSIWGANWKFVVALLPWAIVGLAGTWIKHKELDVLSLNDGTAIGLGLAVEKERRILLGIAVLLASAAVSVSGSIAFIGLMAPHMARLLVGPRHGKLIPMTILIGSNFLLGADIVSRTMLGATEIPTGIVVTVFGGIYFMRLLLRPKRMVNG